MAIKLAKIICQVSNMFPPSIKSIDRRMGMIVEGNRICLRECSEEKSLDELKIDLQSEVDNYYSNQPWYKNMFLNLGITKPPIRVEACKNYISMIS